MSARDDKEIAAKRRRFEKNFVMLRLRVEHRGQQISGDFLFLREMAREAPWGEYERMNAVEGALAKLVEQAGEVKHAMQVSR
jgi:N-glycosylase/DNA lyase